MVDTMCQSCFNIGQPNTPILFHHNIVVHFSWQWSTVRQVTVIWMYNVDLRKCWTVPCTSRTLFSLFFCHSSNRKVMLLFQQDNFCSHDAQHILQDVWQILLTWWLPNLSHYINRYKRYGITRRWYSTSVQYHEYKSPGIC